MTANGSLAQGYKNLGYSLEQEGRGLDAKERTGRSSGSISGSNYKGELSSP